MIDETPIWLLAAGRREEALAVMKKISKYNGGKKDCHLDELEVFKADQEENESVWLTLRSLARVPSLLARVITMFFSWLVNFKHYNIFYQQIAMFSQVGGEHDVLRDRFEQ